MDSDPIRDEPKVSLEAEEAFAAFLVRRAEGQEPELEDLCAEMPQLADELRALHEDWRGLQAILDRLGATATVSQRLEASFGPVNPRIDLERASATATGAPSETRLKKLAAHTPPETRYRLHGEVARGAMGVVYRVFDEDIRRSLAMKVVLGGRELLGESERARVDPQRMARFLEEAQVTGQLDHPGIVPVHELGLDRHGRAFFTMRLVRGKDFRTLIEAVHQERDGWTLTRALGVLQRVCEAVAFAHSKNVIHRDLKPSNVMVGRFGETYVMDWGLAKVLGRKDAHDIRLRSSVDATLSEVQTDRVDESGTSPDSPLVTMDGDVVGTPVYMPPEQASGRVEEIGVCSDVYSVGAMLYHLLTGQRPYVGRGDRVSPHTVLAAVRSGPPAPLRELRSDVPAELEAICEKAMARDPRQRYADMLEMEQDLRAYLENRVVRAHETGALAEFRKWTVRNRGLAAALATLLLAVVAGLTSTTVVFARGKQREADLKLAEREARQEAEAQRDRAALQEQAALAAGEALVPFADHGRALALLETRNAVWPLHEHVEDLRSWLASAEAILARAETHHAALEQHRSGALPWRGEVRQLDEQRLSHVLRELDHLRSTLPNLERYVEAGEESLRRELEQMQARQVELEQDLELQRTYEYADIEDLSEDVALARIVADLTRLEDTQASMEWRLAAGETLLDRTVRSPDALQRWKRAQRDIARDPVYGGLQLSPMLGLLPLGKNASTGLWEFWHASSGDEPPTDERGSGFRVEPGSGIVLVLIPGGTFWMGTSPPGSGLPNEDPGHFENEAPPIQVELEPFFLSKYELTRGQWTAVMGTPGGGVWTGGEDPTCYPAQGKSWEEFDRVLGYLGLRLPSEAQWEYAARGGSTTPYYTGSEVTSLEGFENVYDLGSRTDDERGEPAPFFDGYKELAPVGRYRPNPFGLCDVLGNVAEFCGDLYHPRLDQPDGAAGDHLRPGRPGDRTASPVLRGGSVLFSTPTLRTAYRQFLRQRDQTHNGVGVRPAMDLP